MRDIQKLDLLLTQLAERYGIAHLKLPAHGAIGLRLKDGSELYMEHEKAQGKLYAYMPILALPKDEPSRLQLLKRMLEFNFLESGADQMVLSVREEEAICHTSFRVVELDLDALDRGLQHLIAGRAGVVEKLKNDAGSDKVVTGRARHFASSLHAAFKQGS